LLRSDLPVFELTFSGNHQKEISRIEKICGQSFAESLVSAILARDEGSKMSWKWEKELSKPKLVSFIATPVIKDQPESEVVQAVIRIHGQEVTSLERCINVDLG
jgi:hypothetical protein